MQAQEKKMSVKNPYSALDEFLAEGLSRRFTHAKHLYFDHMTVFLRVATRFVDGQMCRTFDVATVDVDEDHQNKKIFSGFLNYVECLAHKNGIPVYVESILNDDLVAALTKRGYHMAGEGIPSATFKVDQLNKKYSAPDDSPSP